MTDPPSSAEAGAATFEDTRLDRRAAAFFDMDKTLIAENSGSIYLRKRFRNGEVGVSILATSLSAYLRYKMGILDASESTQALMSGLRGRLESELVDEGRTLCEKEIVPLIYPAAAAAVRLHQERGDLVCVVSGSMGFVVEPLAAHLAIEHTVCSQVEIRDGRFTGELVKPLCFEEGKLYWLQEFIERHGIDLARSWFYTDSVTDRPLLEKVGHPVAVNPDPRLYQLARRRGWPVRLFNLDQRAPDPSPSGPEAQSRGL